ncbi:MAG: shikimate dehydrogenase [Clostridia bacterium]|nr:shikimate dehydrogenase [Clostridia bacterium]
MLYGCIGEKLGHSFSKEVHNRIGAYPYELKEIAADALDDFMRAKDFRGINVTIPYKEKVMPHLDVIDESALSIGAVNTVVNRDGKLYGYNTDFYGMESLISHAGIALEGKKIAILGTGGTAKTARAVAKHLGAKEIWSVSRRKENGRILYDELYREHSDVDVIINTTPVGMYPNADVSPLDLSLFKSLSGVIDAVYNPLNTHLVCQAKKRGIAAEGGLFMLVAQAVRASEIFMGTKYEDALLERIYKSVLCEKKNVVLIGMPASGKTTVGRILAQKMKRSLTDTDELITLTSGESIPDIFRKYGEKEFRRRESQQIKNVSSLSGAVIATGGGIVLNRTNVNNLSQNGHIFFLDRSLSLLIPTEDRPLGNTKEAIEKRYEERYQLYLDACHTRIEADGDAEDIAEKIIEEFFK